MCFWIHFLPQDTDPRPVVVANHKNAARWPAKVMELDVTRKYARISFFGDEEEAWIAMPLLRPYEPVRGGVRRRVFIIPI